MSRAYSNHIEKKKNIADAAKRLFLKNGYAETGMDSVAAEAGVTKQTVYRYFQSKEALFEHIIREISDERMNYSFGRSGVLEELTRFGVYFISEHLKPEKLEFFRLMISESGKGSVFGKIFCQERQDVRKQPLTGYFRDRLGMDNCQMLADMYCSMLLAMRTRILMGGRDVPDDGQIADHAQLTAEIFINGLLSLKV